MVVRVVVLFDTQRRKPPFAPPIQSVRRSLIEDIKEYIKFYIIEVNKFNVKNTVRDIIIIFKMMYERSKTNQLKYYPELKL